MTSINIFSTLHIAKTGMTAQQGGLNVTSQNVANVNTAGYTRQRIVLSSVAGDALGNGGVAISGIKRYVDEFANARYVQESSLAGSSNQQASLLTHVSTIFNDLQDSGIGSAIDNFFGSLRQLQGSPEYATVRHEVLARGAELASAFNRSHQHIETLRYNIDSILSSSAAEVNTRVEQISTINHEIRLAKAQGVNHASLLDQRDQLVREIAEHVTVSTLLTEDGGMTVFLEGGLPLVEGGNISRLEVSEGAAPGSATITYVSSNGSTAEVTNRLKSGKMGGALNVRDNILPKFTSELDQLAYDIITAVNAQHSAGFGLDGVGGRNFFLQPAAVEGAALQMSLDPSMVGNSDAVAAAEDPTMTPGDNRNALALAALADMNLAGGNTRTFDKAYATFMGTLGVETRNAIDQSAMRANSLAHIEMMKDSQAGVSIDEEMTNLIQYQRAYQASSRVLSVVDEVIGTLLDLR